MKKIPVKISKNRTRNLMADRSHRTNTVIGKVINVIRKNICILFQNLYSSIITVDNFKRAEFFHLLKYIINANTWNLKRWTTGNIIDSNDTWVFTIFENWFEYRAAKNTAISPDFLVWKFCGNSHSLLDLQTLTAFVYLVFLGSSEATTGGVL